MPMLVCAAQNCVYNQAMYCGKGDIMVGGEEATTCQETCCESFRERERASATSSMGTASQHICVDCEAVKCRYNEDCKCHADEINISGAGAVRHDQTECVTFTNEKEN